MTGQAGQDQPAGLACPGCGHPACFAMTAPQEQAGGDRAVIIFDQGRPAAVRLAFCGNAKCDVWSWSPWMTPAELAGKTRYVRYGAGDGGR